MKIIKKFFADQILLFKKYGIKNFLIKKIKKIFFPIIILLIIPVYILIKIIKPFILIRFGSIYSDRIGHMSANTELYLCEKENGYQPEKTCDFFFYGKKICNISLLKMWKRILKVNPFFYYFWWLSNNLFKDNDHIINTICQDRDIKGLMEKSNIHLSFNEKEKLKINEQLKKMEIKNNSQFICIFARDSKYLDNTLNNRDWSYHNYRDCNINNYLKASEYLASKGNYVIRMGAVVKEPFISDNKFIIDYATKGYRTDLLDIYLSSNCFFFISSGAGIDFLSIIFRRPILYVNFASFEYLVSWNSNIIIIFKKYWLKKEKRFMKFREIINTGVGRIQSRIEYEKHGIELIENTEDEIYDAALEMEERLLGKWQSNKEDDELQRRFWNIFSGSDLHEVIRSRIGTKFLYKNIDLLD